MEYPKDLKYTKEHEWVKIEGDIATAGVTDFAQKQLTDIVFVELPEKGKKVRAGGQMAVIESVKSVSDVFSPVTGEVIEANETLKDAPEIINKEPYGNGWIAKIKMENKSELGNLMNSGEYQRLVGR